MTKYWNSSMHYSQPTIHELQSKIASSNNKANKKGKQYKPIHIEGRQIAKSWWGQAWCNVLENYADYGSRLERGKRYVRSGTVIDLHITKGCVKALVQGRRASPYKVDIHISPLKAEEMDALVEKCSHKISNLETLINGDFPEDLQELFTSSNGLFPSSREISFSCSCPDWAIMCKHVAAVMYGIGAKFDENPFLFFELRGIDVHRLIDVAIESHVDHMLEHAHDPSDRIIEDDDIKAIFGIDIMNT